MTALVAAKMRDLADSLADLKVRLRDALAGELAQLVARDAVTGTIRTLSVMMPLRRMVLVAVGTGAVVAALGYVAPAGIAAALAGIGGCVTAAAAQVGNWFRRSTRRLNAT